MELLSKLGLIAVGGAVGSVLRYLVSGLAQRLLERVLSQPLPVGTLAVNTLGSFAIGFLFVALSGLGRAPAHRDLVLIGLIGGFTTFSTFAYEVFTLANDGQRGLAVLNITLNNVLGIVAAAGGYRLAERIYGVTM